MIYKVKVAVIGDYGVGKSSMINTLQNKQPYLTYSTLGVDFLLQNFTVDNTTYKFHIWDTAGQERFRAIVKSYFRDVDVAIIMYDVTDIYALDNIEKWIIDLDHINEKKDYISFLVGNKIDSPDRCITFQEGKKKADELNLPYFEMCCQDKENVDIFFQILLEKIHQKHQTQELELATHYESLHIKEKEQARNIKKKKFSCCHIL